MAVTSQANTPVSPGAVQWPGGGGGHTAVSLTSENPALSPAILEKNGPWSLFRMLDQAGAVQRGDRLVASFIVGGRDLQYQISTGSSANPFTLPALREFRCPSGI